MKWEKYHRENGKEYGADKDINNDLGWGRDDNNDWQASTSALVLG
jgi:hypothetical protein